MNTYHIFPHSTKLVLAMLVCGTINAASVSALDVTTNVLSDTTWFLTDSPVIIHPYTFKIEEPATLMIEPGVRVQVMSRIEVEGTLHVLGEESNRVVFEGVSGGWGPLYFRQNSGTSLMTNVLNCCDLTSMNSYIYVSQQTLLASNITVATTGSLSYALAAYVNNSVAQPHAAARVEVYDSCIDMGTTQNSAGHSYGVLMDGTQSIFDHVDLNVSMTNDISAFHAMYFHVSNTAPYTGRVVNCSVRVKNGGANVIGTYGIHFESDVYGTVSSNRVELDGAQSMHGIYKYGAEPMVGNTISLVSTSGVTFGYLYGIYSPNANALTNDLIVNNYIELTADKPSRYLTGIYCQAGRHRGNRILVSHTGGGNACGINQVYYGGELIGNSILLSAPPAMWAHGIDLGTHYNAAAIIQVQNNMVCLQGATNSSGLYQDSGCAASVTNSHNIIYGAFTPYYNCTAGIGSVLADPQWDESTLLPIGTSPAIDSGINHGWMESAVDSRGDYPRIDNEVVDIGACEYFHPPAAGSVELIGADQVLLRWQVVTGAVCRLQYTDELLSAQWLDDSCVTSAQHVILFSLTNQVSESRFFRLVRENVVRH